MIIPVMLFSLVTGAVIQSLVPGAAMLGRARIPLLLAIVLYFALTNSRGIMLLAAVAAGLLQDSLSNIPPGYSAFCFGVAGMVVNQYKDDLFGESLLTTAVVGAGAGFVVSLGLSLLLWYNDLIKDPVWLWMLKAAGTAILAALCTPPVFSAVRSLDRMVGNVPSKRHPLEHEEI